MRLLLIALVTTTSLQAQMPYGYDWLNSPVSPGVVNRSAASQPSAPSSKAVNPWRLSVGYAVRSFEADFKMSAPSIGLIAPYLGGYGDVGAYRSGAGTVYYEDGWVGSGFVGEGGTAFGALTSVWSSPGSSGAPVDDFVVIRDDSSGYESRSTQTYHTKTFEMRAQAGSSPGQGLGVGPYVRLSRAVLEDTSHYLGFSVTWSHLFGVIDSAAVIGHPTRIDFNYTYDYADFYSSGNQVYTGGLVVDAATVNALHQQAFGTAGTYRDPRRSETQFVVPEWTATGSSSLDVRLNEVFLSSDVVWKPRPGWELGLSAGPTLNLVNTTLNQRAAWTRSDGLTIPGESTRQSDNHFALGGGVEARARYDLTADGRAFIEAHAGYKWLNALAVDGAAARLDLSSWEVGLGVGIRLDDWPEGSPWKVRAGADVRSFKLSAGAASKGVLKSLFDHTHRAAGFFNGRDTIQYEDGRIYGNSEVVLGLVFVFSGGADRFTIDSSDQAHLTRTSGSIGSPYPYTNGQIEFHSRSYRESLLGSQMPGIEADEPAISPSVEISKVLLVGGPLSIGVTWGWGGSTTELGVGPSISGFVTTRRTGDLISYSYPYIRLDGDGPSAGSNYPYTGSGLVADPINFDPSSGYYPQQSSTPFSDTMHYFALTSASVDVSMQTLSFATDLSWKPMKRLEVGVSAGPTVNVVSTSTDLTTDWIRQDGLLFARLQDHETQTQLRFGWRMLASARYDLDRDGRWFAEARGGYEWMQNIDLGIGLQAASLDASSWQVGAGLGCRLGVKPKMAEIRQVAGRQSRVKSEPEIQNWRDRLLWRKRSMPAGE